MKKNLPLFLMLLISFPAFSQNWAPINTTEKFCYTTDDDFEIINNVLWVDSIQDMGDHDIYYFNKIVAPCDTCADTTYMLLNQSQFLLDYVKVYENGDWVFTNDDQLFILKPEASQSESWVFDDENNITAVVMFYMDLDVLGEPDILKEIGLSNGESIILSQNHGIVHWMGDYHLVGIEGRDLGNIVPTFRNMYQNWSEGDVFCYYRYSSICDEVCESNTYEYKYTIQGVSRFNDSILIYTTFYTGIFMIVDMGTPIIIMIREKKL